MADKKNWRDSYKEKNVSSWRDAYEDDFTATLANNISSRVDTWLQNHNNYISNYQNRNANRKYSYEDSYVSDSADWLTTVSQQKRNFDAEADSIISYMDKFKGYLDEDWSKQVKDLLTSARSQQTSVVTNSAKDNQWWSNWANEDEYETSKRYDGYSKKYSGQKYDNIKQALNTLEDGEEKDWLYYYQYDLYDKDEEYKSKATSGLKSFEAQKIAEKENEEDKTWWEDWLSSFSVSTSTVDSTFPAASIATAQEMYRNDTSYREPNEKWSDKQKKEFGYLYASDPNKAYQYAEQLNNQINAQAKYDQQQAVGDWSSQNFGTGTVGTLGAIASAPLGLADLLDDLTEYSARGTITQRSDLSPFEMGQAAQSGVANKLTSMSGTISDDIPIIGGKGLGDVYSLGVSAANSLVSAYTLGGVGTLVNFIGQGGASGVDDALSRGATPEQALLYGTITGALEGVTEMIPADELLKIGSSSTFKNFLKKSLNQGFGELIEEGASSLFTNIADNFIMRDKSNFYATVKELMANNPGMSEEEAKNKAWSKMAGDIAFDAMGGFATGFSNATLTGGVATAWDARKGNQKNIDALKQYGESTEYLIKEGLESDKKSESYQLAKKYQEQTEGKVKKNGEKTEGKALSGFQIRNLVSANEAQIVKERLIELGETKNVDKIADLVIKKINGEDLTRSEVKALVNSYGSQVAKERTTVVTQSGAKSFNAVYKSITQRVGDKSHFNVSEDGNAVIEETGEAFDIAKAEVTNFVRDKETGKVTDVIFVADGKEVQASGIKFADDSQSYLVEAVSNIENITPADVNAIIHDVVDMEKPLGEQLDGIDEAFSYGYWDYSIKDLKAGQNTMNLTEQQMMSAYELGKAARRDSDVASDAPVVKMRTAWDARLTEGQKTAEQKARLKSNDVDVYFLSKKDGSVTKYDGVSKIVDGKGNKAGVVRAAQLLSKLSLGGGGYYFYESYLSETMKDKDGNPVRVYKDENGVEKPAPNGIYKYKDGKIYIDLNAGEDGQGVGLFALGHELTHFIKHQSKSQFKTLCDLVTEAYDKTDMTMHQRVLEKQSQLEEARGEAVSYDEAYEEVVCDAMSTMISDGNFFEKVAEIKVKDKGLYNTMKRFFKKLFEKFKEVYAKLTPDQKDAQDIRAMKEMFEKIQTAFAEALVESSENFRATQEMDMSNEEAFLDSETAVKNQIRPPYSDGSKAFNEFVEELNPEARKTFDLFYGFYQKSRITNTLSVSGKKVKAVNVSSLYLLADEWNDMLSKEQKWADAAQALADFLPENVRKRMNMNEDGSLNPTMLEKEFKMPSSMAQRLVDALAYEKIDATYKLGDKTITLPTVESRQSVGGEAYRRAIIEETRKLYADGKLKKVGIGTMSKDRWGSLGFLAANGKTGASGDFTTVCPQMMFNRGCWYCYRRAAMEKGVNNKLVANSVWYTGEILRIKDSDIEALNRNGGLRIQSFGDWMPHFSAMLADVLYDAELRGLQVKIITKEPSMINYIAALREQGIGKNLYFNLSADYTIERGPAKQAKSPDSLDTVNPERPYLRNTDNGFWWKRAMTVEEANKYREKYPWVNTRIVATTTEEFIRGLKDSRVDVVTGYHGNIREFERVDSTTGEHKVQVEALGDAGMPRFAFNPTTNKWMVEYEGKTATHKRLAQAIADNNLQYEYYIKTCCITGRCATCEGKCGALARDFNVKNATNRDSESVAYWQKQMQYAIEPEFGDITVDEQSETVKMSTRLDPRKVKAEDVLDLVQRAAYEFDEGTYIPVRATTPPILIEEIKKHSKGKFIPMDLPMIMEVGKVRQATEEDDGIEYENNRPHGISEVGMVEIFKGMGDPAYIVFQKNGRYAEIVRYKDKTGKTALASVDFYGLGDKVKYKYAQYMNGYEGGLYNVVVTTYNPDDLQSYLDDPDNVIIYDKKKGLSEVGSGSKLPSHLTDKPFYEDIVTRTDTKVNKNSDRDSSGKQISKEQKAFFADSKVVDKEGNLLVMYHGSSSSSKFTVFERRPIVNGKNYGDGYYFTEDKSEAYNWGSNNIYKVYLDLKNPYYVSDKEAAPEAIVEAVKENYGRTYDRLSQDPSWWGSELTREEYINKNSRMWDNSQIALLVAVDESDIPDGNESEYYGEIARRKTELLKSLGYDGVIVATGKTNRNFQEVVAFDSEQIKLTTNEKPTKNPDIRFSERVSNKELAAKDDTALYIKNTSKANYIGMIFSGAKTEETRSRRTLDAFIGKDFYVTDGKYVYGSIVLGEPHQYTEEEFHKKKNQLKHRVPVGDEYDIKPGGTKWAYPIESYEKFDKPKKMSDSTEYKNSFQARQVKYSYRGVNRSTDADQIAVAEQMERDGKSSEEIRKETGWFRSYDNRWRYEIDDSKAVWHLDTAKPDQSHLFRFGEKQYKLKDLLEHDELYAAYPKLKDVTVYVNPNTEFGGYVVGRNTDYIAISNVSNDSTTKWTLIHELQHIIQNIEGFATGASKYEYSYLEWGEKEYEALAKRNEVAKKLYAILRRHGESISREAIEYNQNSYNVSDEIIEDNYWKLQNLGWSNKRTEALVDDYYAQVQILNRTTPEGQYHATAGEIEAYDVQARMNMSAEERRAMRPNIDRSDAIVKLSERTGNSVSNRHLLANAFEGMVQDSEEYKMIQQYKSHVAELNSLEAKLSDFNQQIRELRFDPNTERDAEKLARLEEEARKIAEAINKHDKRLLNLEASEPLRKVIEREKAKASQKTKDHVREIQQNKKLRAEQTELRHKIRKTIRDLDKILNRGNKQKNVKEDLQPVVTKALQAAEVLFTDNYGNLDMLRRGIGADLSDSEEALVKSCTQMLKDLDKMPTDGYDNWQARQEAENKLKAKMSKLNEVFARERKRLNNTTVSSILGELAEAYATLENSEQSYVQGAYNEAVHNFLKNLQSEVGGAIVKDMTKAQLESVHAAYTMVLTTVRKANELFNKDIKMSREQLGNAVIEEVLKAGGVHGLWTKAEITRSQADWNNMKPVWVANRIGSESFAKLMQGLFEGQYNFARDIEETKKFKLDMDAKYHPRNWDKDKLYEFESSTGKKFSLNLQQIMSLYAFSKREQAYDHLLSGGFVFDGNSTVIVDEKGIKRTYIHNGSTSYKLNEATLNEIISTLSAEQKSYVDEMQAYLSDVMGAKGNEVSMKLYGIQMFKEKFYFPLRSSGAYMERAKEAELKKQQGQINLVNSSFTHSVKPHAKNPIILSSFMDVWAEHCNEMSMYHSMVLPMEDFRKVYNYSTVHDESMDSASVFQTIQDAYGSAATSYIDQLYRELNAGATVDPRETPFKKMISKFKKSAVMLSASVVVQQFSAVGRAYAVIDPKYFVGTKVNSGTQLAVAEEMKKYAPVAIIKEMGGFDTGTKGSAKAYIMAEQYGKGERLKGLLKDEQYRGDIMGYMPAKADEMTWCAIWEAVKRETKAKNSGMDVKSEEFLKLAGQRFSEVIEKTQVYDSVLARSANMRSKSAFMQMATAFMAEPTTTVNLLEDAIRSKSVKNIARAFGAVAVSIVLNNALSSVVYAMRDDDDDETFVEKYFQSFTSGMIDDLNPMSYYPFLKDVYSLFQGYDVERADMSVIADLRDAVKKVVGLIGKDTSNMDENELAEHWRNVNSVMMSVLDAGCSVFGVPFKNVRRDVNGMINAYTTIRKDLSDERDNSWNSFWDKVGSAAKDTIPVIAWTKDGAKQDKLYEAIMEWDKSYLNRLKSTYKTDTAYENAVRKALRENDPRIRKAAQARYDGKVEEYKRIFREIQNERKFSFDDIMSAINSEENAIKSGIPSDKAKTDYSAADFLDAVILGDTSTAEAMRAEIISTKVANGQTRADAEKQFASAVYSNTRSAFDDGFLDKAGAKKMLTKYAGKDAEEATAKVEYWAFCKAHPQYDLSEANVDDYHEVAEPAGISLAVFVQYLNGTKGLVTKYDAWGDVEVSKKEQVLEVIDSLPLTWEQKDALYLAAGYSEDNIWDVPW